VALSLALVTGMLFGLVPALQSTRVDFIPALKSMRGRAVQLPFLSGLRLRQGLLVLQVGMTLVILVAAGLFLRTFSKLAAIPLGFNPDQVLTFSVNARQAGHNDPEIIQFYRDLQSQFADIPGVSNAGISSIPIMGMGTSATGARVAGSALKTSRFLSVGTGFFSTMEIPILLGRGVDDTDRPGSPAVAVVNQTFVRTFAIEKNPIGQHIAIPRLCPQCDIEIVGVVADSRYGILKGPVDPVAYLAYPQSVWGPVGAMFYELRIDGNPKRIVETVRDIVRRADPRIPLADVKSQRERIDGMMGQEIAFARLCTAFAALALTISCVGLYASMSYNVARQTSEIGIRMALGAQRRQVVCMVLREAVTVLILGLAVSVPSALAATKLVKSFLFEIEPNDPLSLTIAVSILACATIWAGYIPARHAARIDPLLALRHE
jgi:predicted permease